MSTPGPYLFFDFDSTLVTEESLDLVIERALAVSSDRDRLVQEVAHITNAGMEGTLAFTESLTRRFAVVPLNREHFVQVGRELCGHVTVGMEELFAELARHEIPTFIISGGFRDSIMPVATLLGVPPERVFTNTVIYDAEGQVMGVDTENVCYTDDGKAPVISLVRSQLQLVGTVCMIGDGANDLKAYELGAADYFCGFTANVDRAVMHERAPVVARSTAELRDFIFTELVPKMR